MLKINAMGIAQSSERIHDPAHLLADLADLAAIHVINKLVCLASGTTAGLHKLKRLFEKTMVSLGLISADLCAETMLNPGANAILECDRHFRPFLC